MRKSPEPNGKNKKHPGRVSAPSRTNHRTGEDLRKRPQGKSETSHLKGSPAKPSNGKGHLDNSVGDVKEGGMHVDQYDQVTPSPSESKNKPSIYPNPSMTRDVFVDNPPCVQPSETAPIAVVEMFSQQMRRSSATSNYLRGDLIMVDNIPDESNPKPMSRRNSFSSELLKKFTPMNENLRKNSSGNLTRNSSSHEPLISIYDRSLPRNSSSTHLSRRNSSSDLLKLGSSDNLARNPNDPLRGNSSRTHLSRRNSSSDLLKLGSSDNLTRNWSATGTLTSNNKDPLRRNSLSLHHSRRNSSDLIKRASRAYTSGQNDCWDDVRNSPYHHLDSDNTDVLKEGVVPPNTLVGVSRNKMIMPSQERLRSPPVTDGDPVEAATKLLEKYSKESKGNKKDDGSPIQAHKSPLPKRNSMEVTSTSAPKDNKKNRRGSSATEQLLRNYAKQKRRSSANQDHRLHEGRYRRSSAHSSKTDPRSRHLKHQQALIKKNRNENSGGEKRIKKLQSSSSQSSTSNSQCDHVSQCTSIEQESIDDFNKKKKEGVFVEIDLGDDNSTDPNIPSSIQIKELGTEKDTKELNKASKNKNKTRNSKRRSNETKTTADHLYDSVDLDDPIIGVEIPLPLGNRRNEKLKRLTIQRASIKNVSLQKKRKLLVLTFVGLAAVLSISALVFFLIPRGGQKSKPMPPESGVHQNLDNSSNQTQWIVPENASFFDTPLDMSLSNQNSGAAGNVGQIQPKDFVNNPNYSFLKQLSGSATVLPNSPQYKASYWLLEHDSLQIAWNDLRFKPRYGLATVYYALNGDEWIKAERWLGDGDFCTWHGVCCLSPSLQGCEKVFDGHGIGLHLESNNLRGAIPEEISLIELVILDLARNEITGTLPSSLQNLPMLTNLHLDSNQLKGSIANDSWKATSLIEISMRNNLFSGPFPTFVEELYTLEVLDLGANQLSSTIPNIFGRLTGLKKIDLGSNKLQGEIPETVYFLNELVELSLFENFLNGTLNERLFQIKTLQILKLHNNNFSGTLPASIGECAALESLQLHNNELSGTIPTVIGELTSLNNLYLDDNHFIGSLPLEISKLSALRYFDADGNTFTGEIPLVFGELTSIRGLNLGRNSLTGSLPSGLNEQFSQLEYLILEQNKMMGTIEPALWQMGSLKLLDLHQNRFSGSLPKIVGADSLQVIDLDDNNLQGALPNELLLAPELKVAYLRSNYFFGTVDQSVCDGKNLEQLFMDCTSQIECSCCEICT